MRNLKKFLALVLAMMMTLSLMVTANAKDITADFTDADSVTEEFTTAVDVLNGMKVFKGYENGTFDPKGDITRAEMAAIIYRLHTGDATDKRANAYVGYDSFTDVEKDKWYAGYVGYCSNAGLIAGYGNGRFGPSDKLTGYQALVMLLRAMGYDQPNEFGSSDWRTHAASIATTRGMLVNVNKTNYQGTLSDFATRELVAELTFQAAQKERVKYTPAFGYQTGDHASGDNYGVYNTLGYVNYGLDEVEGIIVGNQDTGESKTIINTAVTGAPSHSEYFYENSQCLAADSTTKTPVNTSAKIDAKTGIDMFGHKVDAYYDARPGYGGTTYALYDNVVKTALVTADDSVLANAARNGKLGIAAQKAGFSVDLKDSKAVYNQSFQKSGMSSDGAGVLTNDYNKTGAWAAGSAANGEVTTKAVSLTKDGETAAADYPLYLLISNNSSLTVDMVVAVNVSVSRISQVNAHAKVPTITVAQIGTATDNNNTGTIKPAEWNDKKGGMIDQKALTATSDKDLNTPVVGVAIVGTDPYKPTSESIEAIGNKNAGALTTNLSYRLSKPTQYVEGTVTNFNYTGNTDDTQHTGSIVIGGKKIERSFLADAIAGYNPVPATANRGIGLAGLSATAQLYGNYRAYLDSEGKYVWIEPIYDTKFVYATYIDYTTPYGSSTYEYTLIGVDLEGEQVKQVVKTIDGQPINASNYQSIAPSRDSGTGVAGVSPLSYIGYLISEDGNLTSISDLDRASNKAGMFDTIDPIVMQVGAGTGAGRGIIDDDVAHAIEISSTDAKLGTMNLDQNSNAAASKANTYFTNDTKFIIVDGAGTDTQKVEVLTGLTGLLKGGSKVTIKGENDKTVDGKYLATLQTAISTAANGTADRTKAGATINGSKAGLPFNEQMYYTASPLTYASVDGTNPLKVDTIIIPKEAISWVGSSGLYFVGNPAQDSEIKSGKWSNGDERVFHLYTMYEDGEQVQKWLTNAPGGTGAAHPDHELAADSFYRLYDSGMKTPMGDTVYYANNGTTSEGTTDIAVAQGTLDANKRPDLNALTNAQGPILGNGLVSYVFYNAATYSSQTAIIGEGASSGDGVASTMAVGTNCAIFNVAGAKVVNLNAANSPVGAGGGATGYTDPKANASNASRGFVWPGITDLTSLNDAASTAATYQDKQPKVCVQLDPNDNLTVTVIYVCWNQDTK